MPFTDLAKKLSPKGWAMIGGSAAAAILFLVVLMHIASAPSYTTLMTGVDPSQTGKITSQLSTSGISYQLQNNGTAVAVESDKTAQARVALAGAGLLNGAQPGFSLFDNQQLGESNFQQQVTYMRALEGQLEQTIDSINGVGSAQVQLVLPNAQDQLFTDSSQSASAAVLLTESGTLQPSSVQGIAQLVASSVPGLSSQKVTITDGTGQLLWPTSSGTGAGGGTLSKQSAENQYDSTMAAQVGAALAQIVGPGKAQVMVNADLNANQATSDALTYAKKGVPLQTQTQTETLKGSGSAAGGASGTAGNIGGYSAGSSGSGSGSNYSNKTATTTFGVDKTVTHTVVAPGAINRQSVAVLVSSAVPASEIPAIKAAVTNAVGLVPSRGDTLSVGQVKFASPTPTTPTASPTGSMMKYAKYGAVGLGSLLFLVFVGRMLRKREREPFAGQPTWLRELETPRPLAALEGRQGADGLDQPTEIAQLRPAVNVARRQVEELVQRDPERVAAQVRAWMTEGKA